MQPGISGARRVLVVAGEPSGDQAAARVVQHLAASTEARAFGIGGDRLAASGARLLAHIGELTALGIGESLRRATAWGRAWVAVRRAVRERPPAAALLVDTPEINLPLARTLSAAGIPVVFYVGPQVWAWRPGRLALLEERTSVVALVLPFERPIYERAGVRAEFVGHPLVDEPAARPRDEVRARLGVAGAATLVALLPGSRPGEVATLGPPLRECGARLAAQGVHGVFAPGGAAPRALFVPGGAHDGRAAVPAGLTAADLLAASDAALVASGTATLEAALVGTPLAVIYRLGWLSWRVARRLVDIPYVGLPNWIAGRRVVPELLQREVTGERLAAQAWALLEPVERARQQRELAEVRRRLGGPGAALRVAALVRERLG